MGWILIILHISSVVLFREGYGCTVCSEFPSIPPGYVKIDYTASDEHIVNPSRGFAQLINGRASSFTSLTQSSLDTYRSRDGISMVWRQYIIDSFVSSSISSGFLNNIRQDLEVVRNARWTAVVRFFYTDVSVSQAPYGDATKAWMLSHISQLAPIFTEFEDVIDSVQAGFIGIWGEWYYTTHFGDPNTVDCTNNPWTFRCYTPQNWQDREDIAQALLDNIPDSIPIHIRQPQAKPYWLGWTPTSEAEMEQQSDKARLGHHNDCFLASSTDYGTYINISAEYPYLQADTRYSFMGGETCARSTDVPNRHKCPTALVELPELHYSYLNQAYNRIVLDEWVQDGCYNEIHRNLGYRFILKSAILPTQLRRNDQLCFYIELQNIGYAAPYKQRNVQLVLKEKSSEQLYSVQLTDVDTRKWLPEQSVVINAAAYISTSVPSGMYEVLLAINDPKLGSISDYNILLANRDVAHYSTGLNSLLHEIEILSSSGGNGDPTCPEFNSMAAPQPSPYDRLYCGLGGCGGSCSRFEITNPSFEADGGWIQFGDGYQFTTASASHGTRSIMVQNGGAQQTWTLPAGTKAMRVTADSRNVGIVGSDGNDYSIYCDLKFSDNTWSYGHAAPFSVGESQWHTQTLDVNSQKDIAEGWCYAMFRNYVGGTAYFDNFNVWVSSTTTGDC